MCLWLEEVLVMSDGLEMFISHAKPVIESRAKDLKEWPETIYMCVGYVFDSRFLEWTVQPISMIFGILNK